jgi:prepilin-type N-terminal cleavage/methylation domain-containing protein
VLDVGGRITKYPILQSGLRGQSFRHVERNGHVSAGCSDCVSGTSNGMGGTISASTAFMLKSRARFDGQRGFTLIELLIVMLIIAVIAAGVTGLVQSMSSSASASQARTFESDQAQQVVNILEQKLSASTCDSTYLYDFPAMTHYNCNPSIDGNVNIILFTTQTYADDGSPASYPALHPPYQSDATDLYFFVSNAPASTETIVHIYQTSETTPFGTRDLLQMSVNGVVQTLSQDVVGLAFTYYSTTGQCGQGAGALTPSAITSKSGDNQVSTVGITVDVQYAASSPAVRYSTCFFLTGSPYV